jgi:nitrous oxidase accessory protein NosD
VKRPIIALLLLFIPASAQAQTCGSLQALVDAAQAGSVLTVPACTYRETVTLSKPLTLDGQGKAIIDAE